MVRVGFLGRGAVLQQQSSHLSAAAERSQMQRRHALGATQLRAALRNRHDESLCLIHQLLGAATLRVKACGRNILCRANQLSQ